jgi:hypothetical protein
MSTSIPAGWNGPTPTNKRMGRCRCSAVVFLIEISLRSRSAFSNDDGYYYYQVRAPATIIYLHDLLVFLLDQLQQTFELGNVRLAPHGRRFHFCQFGRQRFVMSPLSFQFLPMSFQLLCNNNNKFKIKKKITGPEC